MSNVAIFTPNQTPQYLVSVNEYLYEGNTNAIINPDVSAVLSIPLKYWKRVGNTIVEMTASEKQAVLDAELAVRKAQADTFSLDDMKVILTALIKVINLRLPSNKITQQEMIDALKAEIT